MRGNDVERFARLLIPKRSKIGLDCLEVVQPGCCCIPPQSGDLRGIRVDCDNPCQGVNRSGDQRVRPGTAAQFALAKRP